MRGPPQRRAKVPDDKMRVLEHNCIRAMQKRGDGCDKRRVSQRSIRIVQLIEVRTEHTRYGYYSGLIGPPFQMAICSRHFVESTVVGIRLETWIEDKYRLNSRCGIGGVCWIPKHVSAAVAV